MKTRFNHDVRKKKRHRLWVGQCLSAKVYYTSFFAAVSPKKCMRRNTHTTTLDMRSRNWKIKRGLLLAEVGCINDRYVKEEHSDFAEYTAQLPFSCTASTHHAMPPIWPRWQTWHDSGSKEHPEVRKEWDVLSLKGARAPQKKLFQGRRQIGVKTRDDLCMLLFQQREISGNSRRSRHAHAWSLK